MKRYNEFSKIQFLKERIERIIDFYLRDNVIIEKSNGDTIRGKYQGIKWDDEDEHFYLLISKEDSRDQDAFECLKLEFVEMTYNGFRLKYKE